MDNPVILIIEDEAPIRSLLRYALEMASFSVLEAADSGSAKRQMKTLQPDLIILDWMLPAQSGVDFIKELRSSELTRSIPVIMLTAKTEEEHKVLALERGADDYVVKPFSPPELIARVKAILRRGPMVSENSLITVAGIVLDEKDQRVQIDEQPIRMGPLEFRLLHFFMTHPNRVYSRDELLNHVWGVDKYIDQRTVDVHVRRLRRRLSDSGYHRFIQTVHGSGYRFSQQRHDG